MPKPAPSADAVVAYLHQHHGSAIENLEELSGGFWSAAYGYRVHDLDLVFRVGPFADGFAQDRHAMQFATPDLPVPDVLHVGEALGHACAISVRHHGRFLEDVEVTEAESIGPALGRLLDALRLAPPPASHATTKPTAWRKWLLDALVDDPANTTHGWRNRIADDNALDRLFRAGEERIGAAQPLERIVETLDGASPDLVDAAIRHHCYEVQIGTSHLGWNAWTGNDDELARTAARTAETIERGPLSF